MKDVILYIHGKGGSAAESEHYRPLFPGRDVIGLDYQSFTPWETGAEIRSAVESLKPEYENIILIANSIGAYFSMNAEIGGMISRAYFVSPIVDMERLITEMMVWANVTEEQLEAEGVIAAGFDEDLSWEYLCYVRGHPVKWEVPTEILYGSRDNLTFTILNTPQKTICDTAFQIFIAGIIKIIKTIGRKLIHRRIIKIDELLQVLIFII